MQKIGVYFTGYVKQWGFHITDPNSIVVLHYASQEHFNTCSWKLYAGY